MEKQTLRKTPILNRLVEFVTFGIYGVDTVRHTTRLPARNLSIFELPEFIEGDEAGFVYDYSEIVRRKL